MKKVFLLVAVLILVFPFTVSAAFYDLPANHWAESYINELSAKKVINGYPDGTFRPNGTLTNGEFLKLIMTASLPELNFSLVSTESNHWAAPYIKVAENYGVLEIDEIVGNEINEPIMRIDVIRIMSLADINIRGNAQRSVAIMNFIDIDDLEANESSLLSHAVAKEIIGGYPDGSFKPYNNLTRAEASKILSVYLSK